MKRFIVFIAFFVCGIAVESSAQDPAFIPGRSYFGKNNYIEYIAGNTPYILSAPHGGSLTPAEIPDRTSGETVTDSNTDTLARSISAAVFAREGKYPHIIICRLRRTKLDANRDLNEASEPNPYATQAWKEFQSFIDTAKQTVIREFGKGFYIDLHGHGHEIQRLELGYLLSSTALTLSDNILDNAIYGNSSSIRTMIPLSRLSFSKLLRGPQSLGSLFEIRGFPAVPSEMQPNPGSALYFSGGYNTQRHGSVGGGLISGVQIECNMKGVRDTDDSRRRFAEAVAETFDYYTAMHLFQKPVVLVEGQTGLPATTSLAQNYPNPFNPRTAISYQLSAISVVKISVVDVLGREVALLVQEQKAAGTYSVQWNASGLPSGVYLYQLRAGSFVETRKMVITK
jgi:hypothetical protein